jgi:hypothetical protein
VDPPRRTAASAMLTSTQQKTGGGGGGGGGGRNTVGFMPVEGQVGGGGGLGGAGGGVSSKGPKKQEWEEFFDKSARAKYWFNKTTGEASWTQPASM